MAKKKEVVEKLRLRVAAYDAKLIDASCRQIVDVARRYDAALTGPIPLPTEFKRYTVNRSTFVHKNSREQFELRVHRRLIDIQNPSQEIVTQLSALNLPSGVDIEVKMMQ